MTEQTSIPSGDNRELKESVSDRKISWLERVLGPENYRIIKGLFKTPASIVGFILILTFILVAVFAPLIAPPVGKDPYKIPRDGFGGEPKAPGSLRMFLKSPSGTNPDGQDEWVHLLGTAQGQYDIFYGIIWGTRTAFKTGCSWSLLPWRRRDH